MSNEIASTIVVINGLAMTAGSIPIFLAIIGSVEPTIFATMTAKNKVTLTTRATHMLTRSITNI